MRRIVLVLMIVAVSAGSAEARRYHFHRHGWGYAPRTLVVPPSEPEQSLSGRSGRSYSRQFPPADWQLQPPDPSWKGRRYVSPSGDAWLAFYASPVEQESPSEHLKAVGFADGEQISNLTADRTGLLVTGVKRDHMFLRQARLACGGRQWHHIALEFPADLQRTYATLAAQAMRVLATADDDGCDTPTAENQH
jgi:hypothetical protein